MRRPGLVATVFPIVAFAAGVMVGKYLPMDWLPGPAPGEERLAPSPGEVFGNLGEELRGLLGGDDSAAEPAGASVAEEQTPSSTEEPAAAELARAFAAQPVLVIGVSDANTLMVRSIQAERRLLRLSGVQSDDDELRRKLFAFVGYYVAVALADPPNDAHGRLVGEVFVQSPDWQPGEEVERTPERSLNRAILRDLGRRPQ